MKKTKKIHSFDIVFEYDFELNSGMKNTIVRISLSHEFDSEAFQLTREGDGWFIFNNSGSLQFDFEFGEMVHFLEEGKYYRIEFLKK